MKVGEVVPNKTGAIQAWSGEVIPCLTGPLDNHMQEKWQQIKAQAANTYTTALYIQNAGLGANDTNWNGGVANPEYVLDSGYAGNTSYMPNEQSNRQPEQYKATGSTDQLQQGF